MFFGSIAGKSGKPENSENSESPKKKKRKSYENIGVDMYSYTAVLDEGVCTCGTVLPPWGPRGIFIKFHLSKNLKNTKTKDKNKDMNKNKDRNKRIMRFFLSPMSFQTDDKHKFSF